MMNGVDASRTHGIRQKSSAEISLCGHYRYSLSRTWAECEAELEEDRAAVFVMLNPSTADASVNDPTIEKCIRFARKWGFVGIRVVNLYAYRATDPAEMFRAAKAGVDVVGPNNDAILLETVMAPDVGVVVAAWGMKAKPERARHVSDLLRKELVQLHYIERAKDGTPKHPLYLKETLLPTPLPY